jgi:hypothetical protein
VTNSEFKSKVGASFLSLIAKVKHLVMSSTRDLEFQGEVIPAQQVHNAFMSALGSVFCEVLEVNDISW